MAQKSSAHPRVVVGQCTLGGGTGVVVVLVPHMPAKAFVELSLFTPGAGAPGSRYAVDNTVAGQFTVQAYDSLTGSNITATDNSVHNYMVVIDPCPT